MATFLQRSPSTERLRSCSPLSSFWRKRQAESPEHRRPYPRRDVAPLCRFDGTLLMEPGDKIMHAAKALRELNLSKALSGKLVVYKIPKTQRMYDWRC